MSNKITIARGRAALAAGRVRTFSYAPYLASYIYSLDERAVSGTGTCSVSMDGVIYWDPEFVEGLDVDALAYVVLHEAMHLLLRHHARAIEVYGTHPDETQRLAMNVAGDLAIKQILAFMRPLRPPGAVYLGCECSQLGIKLDFPPNQDLIAYYTAIMSAMRDKQGGKGGDGDEECESQDEPGESGESGGSAKSRPKQSRSGKPGSRQQKNGVASRCCEPGTGGSAGDGVRQEHETEDDSWGAYKENVYASRLEEDIRTHEGKHPGSVPGVLKEHIKCYLHPQPDPFAFLKSVVASHAANPLGGRTHTYRRLSRKQPEGLCRLRGLLSTQATAVVIVDTSGSMDDRETKLKAMQVIADGLRHLKSVKVV